MVFSRVRVRVPGLLTLLLTVSWGSFVLEASTIEFARTALTVSENWGVAVLVVQRTGDLNAFVTVDFQTGDGTALAGTDYQAVSGRVVFTPGDSTQYIRLPILNDAIPELTEQFSVQLSDPSEGGALGVNSRAVVVIIDNDPGIQIEFSQFTPSQDAGSVEIAVVRGPEEVGPAEIEFGTSDGSAVAGQDYVGTSGILQFGADERRKTVTVGLLNNSLRAPERTFFFALTNPAPPSVLGELSRASIVLKETDPGVSFAQSTYVVSEDAGEVALKVVRGHGVGLPPFSVDYQTQDQTAKAGVDYQPVIGTLHFSAGEISQTITVPIENNAVRDGTRSLLVTLLNPSEPLVLGDRRGATIWIEDNDPGLSFEQSTYSVWRNQGEVTLTVLRGNDFSTAPFTVGYATTDGSAIADREYVPISGLLQFQPGQMSKTVTVPLLPSLGGGSQFQLTIGGPSGDSVIGARFSATVEIRDLHTEIGYLQEVAPPFDSRLTIRRSSSAVQTLSWAGGQLQRRDGAGGGWQTLETAQSPTTIQGVTPTGFYRIKNRRRAMLFVPGPPTAEDAMPLLILLHAYGADAAQYQEYMRLSSLAAQKRFLYCFPDGTVDRWGKHFWNATDACCGEPGCEVDDAGYLRDLISEIGKRFPVDSKRIYLLGHSNGGFMCYRMACEHADLIAAIASLAGVTFLDPARCAPSEPVNILQIHGTADETIGYNGGFLGPAQEFAVQLPRFPGALESVALWARYNGCTDPITDREPTLHLDLNVPGPETVITRYINSPPGGAVELWTILGGSHGPLFRKAAEFSQFSESVVDWLLGHPKP